jgi:hypothetical protein
MPNSGATPPDWRTCRWPGLGGRAFMQAPATPMHTPSQGPPRLKRSQVTRLREVYRAADWPYQDVVEIDRLAAVLLNRKTG